MRLYKFPRCTNGLPQSQEIQELTELNYTPLRENIYISSGAVLAQEKMSKNLVTDLLCLKISYHLSKVLRFFITLPIKGGKNSVF